MTLDFLANQETQNAYANNLYLTALGRLPTSVETGSIQSWLQGGEAEPIHLDAGDCVALPADIPHSFRTVGDKPMRLLGIHSSPTRISTYLDRETDASGYPKLDKDLKPVLKSAAAS